MAHPADIAPKTPAAFAGGRLSPEEAERLASTFRPSWELDDAPFTGPGTLSETDLRALQGGGTHAEVRASAQSDGHLAVAYASNGAHPAPAPTQSHEPENSVIIDRSITADATPAPAPKTAAKPAGSTILGMAPPPSLQVAAPQPVSAPPPAPARPLSRPPTPGRPVAPAFNVSPPTAKPVARAKPASIDLEEGYPKKSKTGLWAGLAVGGVAVLGIVIWLVASSGGSPDKTTQVAPTATKAADDKLSAIPPPPPPTTAAAAPPTADTPPPAAATVAAAPPPAVTTATPIPTTPVTALPQAAPARPAAVVQARPTYGGASPAPRPAGKPKGGQTIVRDVPF